jgi:hypothetical protein
MHWFRRNEVTSRRNNVVNRGRSNTFGGCTMRFTWLPLIALVALGVVDAGVLSQEKAADLKGTASKGKEYELLCPMHPYIVRDDPRYKKCPICGMPFSKQETFQSSLSREERVQQWKADLTRQRDVIVPAIRDNLSTLSAEDRRLAEAQGWCPILEANPLGLFGKPVKTTIRGQPVFLCCKDCEIDAKKDPDQTLAKVTKLKAQVKKLHDVKGKITWITVRIEHENIPGILKKGYMEFSVEGVKGLEILRSGDLVEGKLKLKDGDFKITKLSALNARTPLPPLPSKDQVKQLQAEHTAALRSLVKLTTAEYRTGKVPFERVLLARQALLKAELGLCTSEKERIAVLRDAVALAKGHEATARQRYEAGTALQSDALLAAAARLRTEIALERASVKTPAP